jgi:hypothetical protein
MVPFAFVFFSYVCVNPFGILLFIHLFSPPPLFFFLVVVRLSLYVLLVSPFVRPFSGFYKAREGHVFMPPEMRHVP